MGAQSSKVNINDNNNAQKERAASLFTKISSSRDATVINNDTSCSCERTGNERNEVVSSSSKTMNNMKLSNLMPNNLEEDEAANETIRKNGCISKDSSKNNHPSRVDNSNNNKLSKIRETSSIPISKRAVDLPKHQTEMVPSTVAENRKEQAKNWTYPSPKMFYEAIKRKGWQPPENDIDNVVKIHNVVNERCWQEILKWEKQFHESPELDVSLLRFKGKPREYSPKARLLNAFGYKLPFDRHDWIIDRSGKDVRYVIDFYNAKIPQGSNSSSSSSSLDVGPIAMHLDVRPALDSPEAFYERAYMQVKWMASGRWMQ
jgi:cytochrome c heme-lyase